MKEPCPFKEGDSVVWDDGHGNRYPAEVTRVVDDGMFDWVVYSKEVRNRSGRRFTYYPDDKTWRCGCMTLRQSKSSKPWGVRLDRDLWEGRDQFGCKRVGPEEALRFSTRSEAQQSADEFSGVRAEPELLPSKSDLYFAQAKEIANEVDTWPDWKKAGFFHGTSLELKVALEEIKTSLQQDLDDFRLGDGIDMSRTEKAIERALALIDS